MPNDLVLLMQTARADMVFVPPKRFAVRNMAVQMRRQGERISVEREIQISPDLRLILQIAADASVGRHPIEDGANHALLVWGTGRRARLFKARRGHLILDDLGASGPEGALSDAVFVEVKPQAPGRYVAKRWGGRFVIRRLPFGASAERHAPTMEHSIHPA